MVIVCLYDHILSFGEETSVILYMSAVIMRHVAFNMRSQAVCWCFLGPVGVEGEELKTGEHLDFGI